MNNTYRFPVGEIECLAVSDGTMTYAPPDFPPPNVFLFANAPPGELEDALGKHRIDAKQLQSWTSDYTCLVVRTGEHTVLVDTGAGNLKPTTGKLVAGLEKKGIAPGDIDTVIITHGHPDHLGGITDEAGRITFPDARYVIQREEWDFWMSGKAEQVLSPHSRDQLIGIARQNLTPLTGKIDLIDGDTEIVPGIDALVVPGHTPGMMALDISSGKEHLLVISDLVLHPVHMEQTDWYAAVDVDPDSLTASRRRLLKKAADEHLTVMAFHFPFPGLGKVERVKNTWYWQPL